MKKYLFIDEVGIVLSLENQAVAVTCPKCSSLTDKLHQNNPSMIRDIAWGEQKIYLRVNRRIMICLNCDQKFQEELGFVNKKRNYTQRFKNKIIQEVIESDIKNVAQRNDVSEQEIETMLKEEEEESRAKKPLIGWMYPEKTSRYSTIKFKQTIV